MPDYQIRHDRPNCIGCTACAAIAPDFWVMNQEDGRSDIVDSQKTADGWEERSLNETDFAVNLQAAEMCPVNVIHLVKIGTNERLI